MPVNILNRSGRPIPIRPLQAAARTALKIEGAETAEVSILLTTDEEVRQLNLRYRRVDRSTDVLSFPQREAAANVAPAIPGEPEALGDVVISVDTAVRQAGQHGQSLSDELNLLVIHGILHLLGYDDETESGASIMRERERQALQSIGANSSGLIARAWGR